MKIKDSFKEKRVLIAVSLFFTLFFLFSSFSLVSAILIEEEINMSEADEHYINLESFNYFYEYGTGGIVVCMESGEQQECKDYSDLSGEEEDTYLHFKYWTGSSMLYIADIHLKGSIDFGTIEEMTIYTNFIPAEYENITFELYAHNNMGGEAFFTINVDSEIDAPEVIATIPDFDLQKNEEVSFWMSDYYDDFNEAIFWIDEDYASLETEFGGSTVSETLEGVEYTLDPISNDIEVIIKSGSTITSHDNVLYAGHSDKPHYASQEFEVNVLEPVPEEYIWYIEDLDNIRYDTSGDYTLGRNLDFNIDSHYENSDNKQDFISGSGWEPIEFFTGNFDGNDKSIYNLYMNRGDNAGLFSWMYGSITDLSLEGVDITGEKWTGSLAGQIGHDSNDEGYVQNVYVSGNIKGTEQVGGIAGRIHYGEIHNSGVTANVEGDRWIGGLTGIAYGEYGTQHGDGKAEIYNSYYSDGEVYGSNEQVGGIVGYSEDGARIEDVVVENAKIKGGGIVGGLVGFINEESSLTRGIVFSSEITSTSAVGGAFGLLWNSAFVQDSYVFNTHVETTAYTEQAGGFVGGMQSESIIKNSFVQGAEQEVISDWRGGGFAGTMYADTGEEPTLKNVYASIKAERGLVVGATEAIVIDSFWDTEVSGTTFTARGEGKTTDEMRNINTFSNWSIENYGDYTNEIWFIQQGMTEPLLYYQYEDFEPMFSFTFDEPIVEYSFDDFNVTLQGEVFDLAEENEIDVRIRWREWEIGDWEYSPYITLTSPNTFSHFLEKEDLKEGEGYQAEAIVYIDGVPTHYSTRKEFVTPDSPIIEEIEFIIMNTSDTEEIVVTDYIKDFEFPYIEDWEYETTDWGYGVRYEYEGETITVSTMEEVDFHYLAPELVNITNITMNKQFEGDITDGDSIIIESYDEEYYFEVFLIADNDYMVKEGDYTSVYIGEPETVEIIDNIQDYDLEPNEMIKIDLEDYFENVEYYTVEVNSNLFSPVISWASYPTYHYRYFPYNREFNGITRHYEPIRVELTENGVFELSVNMKHIENIFPYPYEIEITFIGNHNIFGSASQTATFTVNEQEDKSQFIFTEEPIGILNLGATLKGYIYELGDYDNIEVWFEYRERADELFAVIDEWNETDRILVTEENEIVHRTLIEELKPNTGYEYRLVGESNNNKLVTGQVKNFITTDEELELIEDMENFDMGYNEEIEIDYRNYFSVPENFIWDNAYFGVNTITIGDGEYYTTEINDTDTSTVILEDGILTITSYDIDAVHQGVLFIDDPIYGFAETSFFNYSIMEEPKYPYKDPGIPDEIKDAPKWMNWIMNLFLGLFPDSDELTFIQRYGFVFLSMLIITLIMIFVAKTKTGGVPNLVVYLVGGINALLFFFYIAIGYIGITFLIVLTLIGLALAYFKFSNG